jgi:DNA-binding GntR family transcriptional regulator
VDSDFSKADSVYFKLKDLVTHYDLVDDCSLRILPGEHLHIHELSDRVRASATPVRQALERLQGEGLIDCITKRGFFSKIPNVLELQQLYEFALLVLSHNIRKPLHRSAITGGRLSPTEVDGNVKCVKFQAMVIENILEQIAWLSGNGQMHRMIQNFNDRTRYVRCLCLAQSPDAVAQVRESLELIDLIRERDVEGACASLEAQVTRKINLLPQVVRDAQSRWRPEQSQANSFPPLPRGHRSEK